MCPRDLGCFYVLESEPPIGLPLLSLTSCLTPSRLKLFNSAGRLYGFIDVYHGVFRASSYEPG